MTNAKINVFLRIEFIKSLFSGYETKPRTGVTAKHRNLLVFQPTASPLLSEIGHQGAKFLVPGADRLTQASEFTADWFTAAVTHSSPGAAGGAS
jgi:hypothetical protein